MEFRSETSHACGQKLDYRIYDRYGCDAEEGSETQLPSNVILQFITNEMPVEHASSGVSR